MSETTIGYTPYKLANEVAGGKSGATHRSGAVYHDGRKLSDATVPTRTQLIDRELHLILERLWVLLMPLSCEHVSGLNIAVNAGQYRKADGTAVAFAGDNAFALADDTSDQLVWILHSTNALAKGASWPADITTFTPIAQIDALSGAVVADSIRDRRQLVMMQTHASSTSPTGTTATAFTLDSDNAGAGADGGYRHNRGTSGGGEDAEIRWIEASALFRLLAQHTTGTLADLDALSVLISGVAMLDSDGAAKVQSAVAGDGLAHSAGVLSVGVDDSTIEVDTDALQLKDGGISTTHLGATLADKLAQVSIGDASGSSPQSVTVQVLDIQGNNLAESVVLKLGVYDDSDAEDEATNATISVTTGTDLSSAETKVKRVKTNSSGLAVIGVTDGTAETVYVCAGPTARSKLLDCSDHGTVVIS